jgi:DNA segregation ATPase FtsK/SpoIIIE-like protein
VPEQDLFPHGHPRRGRGAGDRARVVLEMGKASTSTLQRRLRLGYGRAARILDVMQREGIIGPPTAASRGKC